jgi:hypothetical protein
VLYLGLGTDRLFCENCEKLPYCGRWGIDWTFTYLYSKRLHILFASTYSVHPRSCRRICVRSSSDSRPYSIGLLIVIGVSVVDWIRDMWKLASTTDRSDASLQHTPRHLQTNYPQQSSTLLAHRLKRFSTRSSH